MTCCNAHEALSTIGAVLGATVSEIDKSSGPNNWVQMTENYYNIASGEDLVLTYTWTDTGQTFWYDIWPQINPQPTGRAIRKLPSPAKD